MTWLALFASALLGGVSATLLASWLQRRLRYRRAVLLIHAELIRNITIFDALMQITPLPAEPWKGWFAATAWREHSPDVAVRWVKRHGDLWSKMAAVYATFDWASAHGRALTADDRRRLRELKPLLRPLVPIWKIRVSRRLWQSGLPGGRLLARVVLFPRRVDANGDVVGRGVPTAPEALVPPDAQSSG